MLNTIEAIFFLCSGVWGILYCTGRLNYSGVKEERRRERVQKHGWILIIASIVMIFCGLWLFFLFKD
jgi:prolipoprotein diacylglyceryltransferase